MMLVTAMVMTFVRVCGTDSVEKEVFLRGYNVYHYKKNDDDLDFSSL